MRIHIIGNSSTVRRLSLCAEVNTLPSMCKIFALKLGRPSLVNNPASAVLPGAAAQTLATLPTHHPHSPREIKSGLPCHRLSCVLFLSLVSSHFHPSFPPTFLLPDFPVPLILSFRSGSHGNECLVREGDDWSSNPRDCENCFTSIS